MTAPTPALAREQTRAVVWCFRTTRSQSIAAQEPQTCPPARHIPFLVETAWAIPPRQERIPVSSIPELSVLVSFVPAMCLHQASTPAADSTPRLPATRTLAVRRRPATHIPEVCLLLAILPAAALRRPAVRLVAAVVVPRLPVILLAVEEAVAGRTAVAADPTTKALSRIALTSGAPPSRRLCSCR
jgi:hypothetical protein